MINLESADIRHSHNECIYMYHCGDGGGKAELFLEDVFAHGPEETTNHENNNNESRQRRSPFCFHRNLAQIRHRGQQNEAREMNFHEICAVTLDYLCAAL